MAVELAARIRESRDELTARWLVRIPPRAQLEPERIIAPAELLDQVPQLMAGMADYLEDPRDEVTADSPIMARALALGELRFAQGFDASEILKQYEILGDVLYSFVARMVSDTDNTITPSDLMVCSHRLFRAIAIVEQVTTAHYLRVLGERVGEREERLRRFNRMLTHELKNRVGATLGAGQLLQEEWLGDAERRRFAGMVTENAVAIQHVLENLTVLSRLEGERRRQRNVELHEVVKAVFRQLRELARGRQVELRIAPELPAIEVNAAVVELCLSNYLSNAIKYADMNAGERWAEVLASVEPAAGAQSDDCELVVRVRDNGLGVPPEKRSQLFERFYRAHDHMASIEGTGLGLSLVQETAESLGGRVWVEFGAGGGSVFAFALPCRRDDGRLSAVRARSAADRPHPPAAAPATVSD